MLLNNINIAGHIVYYGVLAYHSKSWDMNLLVDLVGSTIISIALTNPNLEITNTLKCKINTLIFEPLEIDLAEPILCTLRGSFKRAYFDSPVNNIVRYFVHDNYWVRIISLTCSTTLAKSITSHVKAKKVNDAPFEQNTLEIIKFIADGGKFFVKKYLENTYNGCNLSCHGKIFAGMLVGNLIFNFVGDFYTKDFPIKNNAGISDKPNERHYSLFIINNLASTSAYLASRCIVKNNLLGTTNEYALIFAASFIEKTLKTIFNKCISQFMDGIVNQAELKLKT